MDEYILEHGDGYEILVRLPAGASVSLDGGVFSAMVASPGSSDIPCNRVYQTPDIYAFRRADVTYITKEITDGEA